MTTVGITGHQGLTSLTEKRVASAFHQELASRLPVFGFSSLAEGADQLFAQAVLDHGGRLTAVVPSRGYETSFGDPEALARFQSLKNRAVEVIELDFDRPSEEAYWAAGRKVVDLADEIFAVWDGQEAGGLGGTADVVAYARENNVPVTVVWPTGSSRR